MVDMNVSPKPICFVRLRAEIAFDRMKLTPERRMDELELLMTLGDYALRGAGPSTSNFPIRCKTDSNLHLE